MKSDKWKAEQEPTHVQQSWALFVAAHLLFSRAVEMVMGISCVSRVCSVLQQAGSSPRRVKTFVVFFSLDFLSLLGEFSWGEVRLSFTSIPEGLWYDVRRKEENRGYRLYHCRCWAAGSSGHCDDSGLCHLALGEQIHLNELKGQTAGNPDIVQLGVFLSLLFLSLYLFSHLSVLV